MRALRVHRAFLADFKDLAAAGGLSPEALLGAEFATQAALRHIDSQIALIEAHVTEARQ
jgi:hypothetical protein